MEIGRIKEILIKLGMSEWEAGIYAHLVLYGPMTAIELARLSRVPRSKTYEVATRLRRKGFVMKIPPMPIKGVTQKFSAINPEKVFPSLISEMQELSTHLGKAYKNPIKPGFPNMNIYTSKEGVKELFASMCSNSKFIYFYLANTKLKTIVGTTFEQKLTKIKKKNFILQNNAEMKAFAKNLKNVKFLNETGGLNYIITSESVILDLWETQHMIIELVSKEAVKTFMIMYALLQKQSLL